VHVSTSQATENVIYPGEQGPRGANWPVNQSRGAATASVTCLGLLFSPSPLLSLSPMQGYRRSLAPRVVAAPQPYLGVRPGPPVPAGPIPLSPVRPAACIVYGVSTSSYSATLLRASARPQPPLPPLSLGLLTHARRAVWPVARRAR
jgi:hypothetical protein